MDLIASYTILNEYLGEHFKVQRISRGAMSNTRIGKDLVTLDIPVHGKKDRGVIHVTASKLSDR